MKPILPSRRRRVLRVDVEPGILAAFERTTREGPDDMIPTGDPEEALQRLRSWEIGVLLSDTRMHNAPQPGTTKFSFDRTPAGDWDRG